MSTDETKPREFWIEQFNGRKEPSFYAYKDKPKFSLVRINTNEGAEIVGYEYFHVIEYRALEQAQKQIEDMNKNCISLSLHDSRMRSAEKRVAELEAEINNVMKASEAVAERHVSELVAQSVKLGKTIAALRKIGSFPTWVAPLHDGNDGVFTYGLTVDVARETLKELGEG